MLSRRLLRIKVVKAIYAHIQCNSDNLMVSQKNLLTSVDQTYNLYLLLLSIPAEMARLICKRHELAKEKHYATYEDLNPATRFVDSKLVQLLENSDSLNDLLISKRLSWVQYPDMIKELTDNFVNSERYKSYCHQSGASSIEEDLALLSYFFVEQLQDNENFDECVESISNSMSGELSYALPLVMRTLGYVKASSTDLKIMKCYKNEDDINFVKGLFERTIVNLNSYNEYIERFTANWDAERIVMLDNVILTIAMAEMLNFPDIPIKVTLNEYIEISKYYSTPGSSNFVNGLMDIISKSLDSEGRIKKSGRGLL